MRPPAPRWALSVCLRLAERSSYQAGGDPSDTDPGEATSKLIEFWLWRYTDGVGRRRRSSYRMSREGRWYGSPTLSLWLARFAPARRPRTAAVEQPKQPISTDRHSPKDRTVFRSSERCQRVRSHGTEIAQLTDRRTTSKLLWHKPVDL